MIRLGVAVRILGKAGLRVRDARRAEHAPHLSVSLLLVREVLRYLAEQRIGCYRLADDLAPYLTDPGRPQFSQQIDECAEMLRDLGALARALQIRLTMHLPLHVSLGAQDEAIAARSMGAIIARARLFDALEAGPDSVLVLHVGGARGEGRPALERFARRFMQLPELARRRLALEQDEASVGLPDLLWLHQRIGIPVVLDTLHLQMNNRERIGVGEALGLALATWPRGQRPKVHFSSQRTESHVLPGSRGHAMQVLAPRHGQHADFVNPFEFAAFALASRGLPDFDVMLEAKAADLALLRLREDLRRFAPDVAQTVA